MPAHLEIRDDLKLKIAHASVRVSQTEGLHLAEMLARRAFRRALTEEARDLAPDFDPDAPRSEVPR